MIVTFAPRGILQIDEAKICFKNFSGTPSQFNREGDRNFSIIIDDSELAERLRNDGWNIKIKEPRDASGNIIPNALPRMTLPVKIKFNDYGPRVILMVNGKRKELTEETVGIIDKIDISDVSLDVRPYDWTVNGKDGRTAYLKAIKVTQRTDRFDDDFEEKLVDFELASAN